MKSRKVVFVRHNFDREIVQQLWMERQIALRFQDTAAVHPAGYEQVFAQHAIRRLRDYCTHGALVGASYRSYKSSRLLAGTIGPGNPDEMIRPLKIKGYFHKIVQLEDVKEFSYRDWPILAVQPTHGTISEWHIAGKHLEAIYGGKCLPRSVEALVPSQLEVLCYEYLRLTGGIDTLILPIGRGLPDIDICGFRTNGKRVIAQVTHHSERTQVKEKLAKLREYSGEEAELLFFGPEKARFTDEIVRYVATEDVFLYLEQAAPGSSHWRMIEHMLGKNS